MTGILSQFFICFLFCAVFIDSKRCDTSSKKVYLDIVWMLNPHIRRSAYAEFRKAMVNEHIPEILNKTSANYYFVRAGLTLGKDIIGKKEKNNKCYSVKVPLDRNLGKVIETLKTLHFKKVKNTKGITPFYAITQAAKDEALRWQIDTSSDDHYEDDLFLVKVIILITDIGASYQWADQAILSDEDFSCSLQPSVEKTGKVLEANKVYLATFAYNFGTHDEDPNPLVNNWSKAFSFIKKGGAQGKLMSFNDKTGREFISDALESIDDAVCVAFEEASLKIQQSSVFLGGNFENEMTTTISPQSLQQQLNQCKELKQQLLENCNKDCLGSIIN